MTAATSAPPVTDGPPQRDPLRESSDASRTPFVSVLANALAAPATFKLPAAKKAEGTSELDADTSGAPDAGDAGTPGTSAASDARATRAKFAATLGASVNDIVRSVAALDPALQAKLARVADRVRDETGHDVTINETYRSQARQDALYAQGRDTAGPVVTWTLDSKHTQGRAVDVTLDGGAANSDAYAALQRIAQEEGLRTLGARDPGHLELPGDGQSSQNAQLGGVNLSQLPSAARVTSVSAAAAAPVSQVAQVAQAAPVARVAPVASVAKPGATQPAQSAPGVQHGRAQSGTSSNGNQNSQNGGSSNGQSNGGYRAVSAALSSRDVLPAVAGGAVAATDSAAAASSSAARVEKVMAAVDAVPARPVSRLSMAVDAGNGAVDKVDVAVRGNSVATVIDASDPRAAQAMTLRSDDLARALSKGGLTMDQLSVRSTAAAAAPASTNTHGSPTQDRASRGGGRPDQQEQQERRRSQEERRQQQRDQRGVNAR